MVHSFRPMAVTCALLTTIALHAASYLTVTDSNGSKTSFELSQKPAISFTYNSLRLVAGEQTIDYPLTEYRSFTLTDDNETTGISATKQAKASPCSVLATHYAEADWSPTAPSHSTASAVNCSNNPE